MNTSDSPPSPPPPPSPPAAPSPPAPTPPPQQSPHFYTTPLYSPQYPLSAFSAYPPPYFQPPVFPVQPGWQQHASYAPPPYYPWAHHAPPRDPSPPPRPAPRRRGSPAPAPSADRPRPASAFEDDDDHLPNPLLPPASSPLAQHARTPAAGTPISHQLQHQHQHQLQHQLQHQHQHQHPNPLPPPPAPASPASAAHHHHYHHHHDPPSSANSTPQQHRRTPRRRAPDRRDHHPHPHHHQKHPLDSDPTADLDTAAKKAVETADHVTLVLLLTSWANSLGEAPHATGPAAHFETVFHASRGLEIVTGDVLLSPRLAHNPAVRKALVALLVRVLYAHPPVHDTFASALVRLNAPLAASDERIRDKYLRERQLALRNVLNFLRDLAANISAYIHILPTAPAHNPDPPKSARSPPSSNPSAGPAGPDPTKAVERSMDTWRRAVARLQGEMAIVVVLTNAQRALDNDFRPPQGTTFHQLHQFYITVRDAVHAYISNDLAARRCALAEVYWPAVLQGADQTVFAAARSRAVLWLSQFETACREVESQLDDAGIGFGPPARVSTDKFSVLVSASAGVAALVSCHQHSFTWANDTARLLSSMVTAFRCLERVANGTLCPTEKLRASFFRGLDTAFSAIDDVVNWSFSSLHDKVLGSLERSCAGDKQVGDTNPPRIRHLRFEEPPKTPSKDVAPDGSGTPAAQNRRKPRHARMKSSPDSLLHLNARIDNDFDEDEHVPRNIDTDLDRADDRESDQQQLEQLQQQHAIIGAANMGNGAEFVFVSAGNRPDQKNHSQVEKGAPTKKIDDELPVVYEGKPLQYGEDDEDDDDRDIIVHEDLDDSTRTPKKSHTSHIRSMSVDGIPF